MIAPSARCWLLRVKMYGPGSAAAVPASFQKACWPMVVPLFVWLPIGVQPDGAVIVVPLPPRWAICAIMMSFASVPVGRVMLMLVRLPPTRVEAARNAIAASALLAGNASTTASIGATHLRGWNIPTSVRAVRLASAFTFIPPRSAFVPENPDTRRRGRGEQAVCPQLEG